MPWIDRSLQMGAPECLAMPTVCLIPPHGDFSIAYTQFPYSPDHISGLHSLWRDTQGQPQWTNLTAEARAPNPNPSPFSIYNLTKDIETVLWYDGQYIVDIYYPRSTDPPGYENLSGTANAPRASYHPVGYYTPRDDIHHVWYPSSNGHIHEIFLAWP